MLRKTTFALTMLASALVNREVNGQSYEQLMLEVGGFSNGAPDPNVDPNYSSKSGYMRVTGKPGFWVYPMFQVSIRTPTTGTTPARDQFLVDFPFLQDVPTQTLGTIYGTVNYTFDPNFPVYVDGVLPEDTVMRALYPLSDLTARMRMQPIVPPSGSGASNANTDLMWSCEPSLWNQYIDPPTRDHWRALRFNDRNLDGWGPMAVNFDELIHETIGEQVSRYYTNYTSSQIAEEVRSFFNDNYSGSESAYDHAIDEWGVRIVIQFFAIRATTGSRTNENIVATGLKGVDEVTDSLELLEEPIDYPEIILSDAAEVVFATDPSTTGNSTWPAPKNASADPIVEVDNVVTINASNLTTHHDVIWKKNPNDASEQAKVSSLEYYSPGNWSFSVFANPPLPTGVYHIIRFRGPNNQLFPKLTTPIPFMITQ